jgi:hypothetical protein
LTATLYATTSDLRQVLDGTDAGTGTASVLSDEQLTLALQAASNRISIYAGGVFDGSSPAATPPDIFHDLALDLACFWASKTYLKHKVMDAQHPVWLAYQNAMDVLKGFRDGTLRPDPGTYGGVGNEGGHVINRIPGIFRPADSDTVVNPFDGTLDADTSPDTGSPGSGWEGFNSGVELP